MLSQLTYHCALDISGMNAETKITANTAQRCADPRPVSAVSTGVGISGLIGLISWIAIARHYGMDGPYSALVALMACGIPMVLWSLAIDKVHRNVSTGINWAKPKGAASNTRDISLTKIAGTWATWGVIAVVYCTGRWYWDGNYPFAMTLFTVAAPFLLMLSIPYIFWTDRYLVEPRDGAFAFGQWVTGTGRPDRILLYDHFRSWAVKGFFLAFMLSIVPGGFGEVVRMPLSDIIATPLSLVQWLIIAMFVVDVAFATIGYMLTMKPLDAHIRSANPHMGGWTAALICYPPFILMSHGGPLDYHQGLGDWSVWFASYPVLLLCTGVLLVLLTAIYAWATVAFGLRFSNLTHRGIITHGPYVWTKHPAYLSKNIFWWVSSLPFLTTTNSLTDAVRNTVILALVSGVYYWRARTEEAHLRTDPAYRVYADWMERNGVVSKLIRRIIRSSSPHTPC